MGLVVVGLMFLGLAVVLLLSVGVIGWLTGVGVRQSDPGAKIANYTPGAVISVGLTYLLLSTTNVAVEAALGAFLVHTTMFALSASRKGKSQ
jgi:uncharacterized MnhB-related membrane protein